MYAALFSAASTVALVAWLILIAAPRHPWLITGLRFGVIGALCILYTVLVFVHLFTVENGGFGSIGQVRALFASDGMLVAGWVHYLAFDLFVGTWIAVRLDARGVSRLIQAPILVATFLFGPVGLLIALAIETALTATAPTEALPTEARS